MTARVLGGGHSGGRASLLYGAAIAALLAGVTGVVLVGIVVPGGSGGAPVHAARLDQWMAREVPDSPLVGLGRIFVADGVANGVDPRFMVAVARHESVLGTAGGGAAIHNAFGWGPHIPFGSWEENIAAVARGLATGYLDEGRTTIPAIGARWAPIGAANDPTGLNNHWVEAVSRFYRDLGGDPAGSVAYVPPTPRSVGPVSRFGFSWPVEGVITSGFGQRWGRLHAGLDIAGPAGAPIGAAAPGRVSHAGVQGGYGNLVVLDHGGGTSTAYAHLESYGVGPGDYVDRATQIGGMGTTGSSTGVHLHFEVRVLGRAVDPRGHLPTRMP